MSATVSTVVHRPACIFEGYAFDLDGTLYLGERALPGAAVAIRQIREAGSRVVFVTNNPLRSAAEYAEKLTRLDIPAREEDVVTTLDSLSTYLEQRHTGARLLCVGEPLLADTLVAHGFRLTRDPAAADVVVVAFDRTFDYAKLNAAYRAVRLHGAALVATNPDPYCPTPDGGMPDCAAMLAAVEASTGVRAEAIVGKPSEHMAHTVLSRLALPPDRVAMVGDRLLTDIGMASAAGMAGILVLSGATSAADLKPAPIQPHFVIEGLSQLLPGLGETDREGEHVPQ